VLAGEHPDRQPLAGAVDDIPEPDADADDLQPDANAHADAHPDHDRPRCAQRRGRRPDPGHHDRAGGVPAH
jgi:hypothetical protein